MNYPNRFDFNTKSSYYRAIMAGRTDAVLCGDSALEYYRLSNDNLSGKVYVYSNCSLPDPFVVLPVKDFSNIDYEVKDGVMVTTVSQTINDLLEEDGEGSQPLYEALNYWYFTHGESWDGLNIKPQNTKVFAEVAKVSLEYYED